MCVLFFFFFKQKTAYEMRISDWSSDVCSSDLEGDGRRDFLWLASATHRDLRSELGGRLLGLLRRKARRCLQSRRFDRSGAHGIHPNSAVFQLQCPSTREVSHSRLAGGVGAETWKPQHVREDRKSTRLNSLH